jgi:ketosteroid isomerase-like protein
MPPEAPVNLPEVVEEVRAVVARYEAALTGNDIPAMDALFWDAPQAVRYGVGENLYGFSAIAAFRRARRTGPFRRDVLRHEILAWGRDVAVSNLEYRREGHDRPGRETKMLVRTADGWRIVSAHVSLLGETV